jgi:hypothetical protein
VCRLCREIEKDPPTNEADLEMALGAIAKASAKKGAEHFKKLLDELLGTEVAPEDSEVAAAWEKERRG